MNTLSLIRRPIETELQRYKSEFDDVLTHEDDYLGKVLDYVRSRTGKMMRPILLLLIAREFGPIGSAPIRSAVSLELLHTASLIHDDVVDESTERRGKASVNSSYGNKIAVLIGDYMLSKSLYESSQIGDIRIVDIIARLGGTLSEGEVKQLSNIRTETLSESTYFEIIRHKTAALFVACARLGAISQKADATATQRATELAEILGLCFQIRDDIFDYYAQEEIGKPTGTDMAEGKITLPAIFAVNQSHDPAIHQLARNIKKGDASVNDIRKLIDYSITHGGIDYARNYMENLRKKAIKLIEEFQNKDVRESLKLYLDFTINRTK